MSYSFRNNDQKLLVANLSIQLVNTAGVLDLPLLSEILVYFSVFRSLFISHINLSNQPAYTFITLLAFILL